MCTRGKEEENDMQKKQHKERPRWGRKTSPSKRGDRNKAYVMKRKHVDLWGSGDQKPKWTKQSEVL